MKNIFIKSILSLLVIFSSISCQDELERLYQDPDGFSKEQADQSGGVSVIAGFFTSQLTRGFFFKGRIWCSLSSNEKWNKNYGKRRATVL